MPLVSSCLILYMHSLKLRFITIKYKWWIRRGTNVCFECVDTANAGIAQSYEVSGLDNNFIMFVRHYLASDLIFKALSSWLTILEQFEYVGYATSVELSNSSHIPSWPQSNFRLSLAQIVLSCDGTLPIPFRIPSLT